MKKTAKITLSAMMAALSAAFMMTSLFPYLTYAIPAIAGLFVMITVIEVDKKWAFASYVSAAAVIFILPADTEAKLLYIAFFGYYPILKSVLEKCKSRILEYLLKFAVFNAAILISYGVIAAVLLIDIGDMGEFGKYTAVVLLVAANIVFPIYDLAVSRMAQFYMVRLHRSVARIFTKK